MTYEKQQFQRKRNGDTLFLARESIQFHNGAITVTDEQTVAMEQHAALIILWHFPQQFTSLQTQHTHSMGKALLRKQSTIASQSYMNKQASATHKLMGLRRVTSCYLEVMRSEACVALLIEDVSDDAACEHRRASATAHTSTHTHAHTHTLAQPNGRRMWRERSLNTHIT